MEQVNQAETTAYRQTAQRAMILAAVKDSESHLTAGEIFERVRRRDPRIAYGTVYRSLHLLAQHGQIQELTFADQSSRYDARAERHDHVHCTSCGVLADVEVPVALIARHVAEERSGFSISSHHTVFAGLCPVCRGSGNDWDSNAIGHLVCAETVSLQDRKRARREARREQEGSEQVTMSQTPMFEVENLHVSIEDKEILKGVNLTVNPARFTR